MVIFELGVGILSAAIMTGMLAWTLGLIGLQIRCSDGAGQIARQLARDDKAGAGEAAERVPEGAEVEIVRTDDEVKVLVGIDANWGVLRPVRIQGQASAPSRGR